MLNSSTCFLQYGENNSEGGTFTEFTLTLDLTLVEIDNLLHISQSETEALHVMYITCMHTIELIEDLLDVLLLDAQTRVADLETQMTL